MSICSHKTIEGLFYAFIETTSDQSPNRWLIPRTLYKPTNTTYKATKGYLSDQ